MESYHQSQPYLSAVQVASYEVAAKTQEDLVLDFFRLHPTCSYSPEQIQTAVLPDAPLTSVRRAITNLTSRGELVRADGAVVGRYGRPVGVWMLARREARQLSLFERE
jgi:hypothetical protein